jgi:hypothetical protein
MQFPRVPQAMLRCKPTASHPHETGQESEGEPVVLFCPEMFVSCGCGWGSLSPWGLLS